jgi:hypothetical protein
VTTGAVMGSGDTREQRRLDLRAAASVVEGVGAPAGREQ